MKKNRLLLILGSLVIIYSIVGFVALPKLIKPQIEKVLNESLTQKVNIESIEFNPFLLKLSISNFRLFDKKEITASIDELSVDFSVLKSIHESHISFHNLQIVNPYINIIQYEDGSLNLEKLVKNQKTEKKQDEKKSKESKDIKFQIYKTFLQNAKIVFTKQSFFEKPYRILIDKLNYTFYNMGTYRNALASHSLSFYINNHTKFTINGGVRLSPFNMYGKVVIKDLKPKEFLAYEKDLINFEIDDKNKIDLDFGYKVNMNKQLKFSIDDLNLNAKNINLSQNKKNILSLESLNIDDANLSYPSNKIDINFISLENFDSNIINNKDGKINLQSLIKQNTTSNKKEEQSDINLNISLDELNLKNINTSYKDKKNSFLVKNENLNLTLKDFRLRNKTISLDRLSLKNKNLDFKDFKNKINVSTKKTTFNLSNLKKDKENINIKRVTLKNPSLLLNDKKTNKKILAEDLSIKLNNIEKKGDNINITKINFLQNMFSLKDNQSKLNLITKNIDIAINKTFYENNFLKIEDSNINKPFISLLLEKTTKKKEDTKTEKSIKKITKNKDIKKKKENSNFAFDIGPVKINNMKMSFEDKNLPIPFKTNITKLKGEFSRLNSNNSKPTKLNLEGTVNKYGYTKITGTVDINDIKLLTDTNLLFKNIAIKNFTPYTGKFVGREIESGKLNLDLKYNIKKSDIDANNSIVISKIKLGKNVKSEDATNLPLELAIALLEDSSGIIDLNIPVKGNVDSPEFSIGSIVWKAFTNLIIKAVASPFTLLGSIFGISEEELKSLEFEYGKSDILVSEKEALDNITKILEKKPKLALEIEPTYNPIKDKEALQYIKFDNYLLTQMDKIPQGDAYQKTLEELYSKEQETKSLEELKKDFTTVQKDKKEIFNQNKYLNYLKKSLASKQIVKKEELINLAKKRVENIKNYLLKEKNLSNDSIKILDIKEQNKKGLKWLIFNLGISVKN